MPQPIARIVDAHVHFWDPARTEWYPYLSGGRTAGGQTVDVGNAAGMARRFMPDTYLAESARWNVEKTVHVSAAGGFIAAETREREALGEACGLPAAIIGGIRAEHTVAEATALLDDQTTSSRFRGVRMMGPVPGGVPAPGVLRALHERDLVFEVLTHTDGLEVAAAALADWGDLTVVVEHAGWPRAGTDEEYALWQRGIGALAALPNVHCKLSGLAMPLQSMDPAVYARWIHHALEVFGVDRCFFASNFPVDSSHGTFDELYTTFDALTADLGDDERAQLFATNAEALYRC